MACAAVEVKKTAKLLDELNEANARCRMAHVYWTNGAVFQQAQLADTADRGSLPHTGQSVAHIANDLCSMIAAVCGGRTPLNGDTASRYHRVEEGPERAVQQTPAPHPLYSCQVPGGCNQSPHAGQPAVVSW